MKKFFGSIGMVLVGLVGIVLVRTLMFTPPPLEVEEQVSVDVDVDVVALHLSEAIRFKTVSPPAPQKRDNQPFDDFLAWAEVTYPALFALDKTTIERHTVLIKWQGKNTELRPILLVTPHSHAACSLPIAGSFRA